jgi:hypothetical protein
MREYLVTNEEAVSQIYGFAPDPLKIKISFFISVAAELTETSSAIPAHSGGTACPV